MALNFKVHVYGRIAYVSQTDRIQIGSIRENIIFEFPMDDAKKCKCSLIKDIEMLPVGDLTEIG
jgi:ATP-binding cassette subfamily C (CFTR/MRP) protein 2